ncbi:hypothetical protein BGZ51_000283, partial [Haplosporangium sp. Z 767]
MTESNHSNDDSSMEEVNDRRRSMSMDRPDASSPAWPTNHNIANDDNAYSPPPPPSAAAVADTQHSPRQPHHRHHHQYPHHQHTNSYSNGTSGNGNNYPTNGHVYNQDHDSRPYYKDHGYASHNGHGSSAPHYHQDHHHAAPSTPSPPLPSSNETFQGRSLPPIEPSHPLHSYMSNSRRGSVVEPEYHPNNGDMHRRPSASLSPSSSTAAAAAAAGADCSSYYGSNSTSPSVGGAMTDKNRPHYASTSPGTAGSTTPSEPHYHSHAPNSPMQLRNADYASGRRESLPSIHSSAGPLGQLLAQEPQRRHSIAHSDPLNNIGPMKRKTSGTPLSQVHNSNMMDHPSKRRDSIPDAPGFHPYPARSSYSAPSSPPRRGSIAHNAVPTLNLQPAAEIKPSMLPAHGPPGMEYGRPHFPLHQPRRPSLLSESGSRRSSVADIIHPPHSGAHGPLPPSHHSPYPQQDYDHRMNMDMEKMHLSSHGSEQPQHKGQGVPPPLQGSHLYPGYPGSYPGDGTSSPIKGDTPYSRSPELRVSHKLAERKRRKEMKELFDELRDSLPVDRSLKTSKWEILSKAVDYIGSLKANEDELTKEVEALRQE